MLKLDNRKLITITAPSAAGKTHLLSALADEGIVRVPTYTTRKPRIGEIDGVDYKFLNDQEFDKMRYSGLFIESIEFGGAKYGSSMVRANRAIDSGLQPAMILEPSGVSAFIAAGIPIFSVFVDVKESIRLERLKWRLTSSLAAAKSQSDIDASHATYQRRHDKVVGEERNWIIQQRWDCIVPGVDEEEAIKMIKNGIAWHNRRLGYPQ